MEIVHTWLFVHGYGVLTAFSVLVALFLLWRELRRTSHREETVFDILFVAAFIGLATGRLLFFFFEHPPFKLTLFNFLIVYVFPGFSELGIYLGFFAALYVLCVRYKERFTDVMQLLAVPFVWMLLLHALLVAARDVTWVDAAKAALYGLGIVAMHYKVRKQGIFPFLLLLISLIAFLSWIGYSVMRTGGLGVPSIEALAFAGLTLISGVWFGTSVSKITN